MDILEVWIYSMPNRNKNISFDPTPSFLWSASPCGISLVWVEGAAPIFYIQEAGVEEGSHCTTMKICNQPYGCQ